MVQFIIVRRLLYSSLRYMFHYIMLLRFWSADDAAKEKDGRAGVERTMINGHNSNKCRYVSVVAFEMYMYHANLLIYVGET